MEIVKPYAELWIPKDIESHIVRCGQLCYASEKDIANKKDWLEGKWKNGHKSIFRHGTHYFAIPVIVCTERMRAFFSINPYCGYYENKEWVFVSVNDQTYRETKWMHHLFKYSTSEDGLKGFIENEEDSFGIIKILRRTVLVQTQISTSRELNRTSPNNICEQSTRYCNFTQEKFNGEVKLCQPHWLNLLADDVDNCFINYCGIDRFYNNKIMVHNKDKKPYTTIESSSNNILIVNNDKYSNYVYDYLDGVLYSTNKYDKLVKASMPPQDARGELPIDTATKVAYTYRIEEWKHILDLRYYGTTGKPHPNARIAANNIRNAINPSLPKFEDACWSEPYFPEDYLSTLTL